MEVILLTKIDGLGSLGDVVKVKSGYARNYLIPQQKAQFATPEHIEAFEHRRADLEEKEQEVMDAAMRVRDQLHELTVRIEVNIRTDGAMYGSVGSTEIVRAVEIASKQMIGKQQVRLPHGPFRELGSFSVELSLFTDISAQIRLEIVAQE